MAESARITRSTDECEMSRSCHRAMFSKAAWAFERTMRASPQICSEVTGFALVRHRGRTLLTFGERFLGFANLGALEMADFEGNFLECRGDERERADPCRVAIARDDLRSNGGGPEVQSRADLSSA
jgi:hypothetical protein